MMSFALGGLPLTDTGLHAACDKAGVDAAELWAVIFTETDPPYGGFFPDASPQILFERHVFQKLTSKRFDQSNPEVSGDSGRPYGAGGAHQYARLSEAVKLDPSAALQSASWGIGQTLGENYKEAGFGSPYDLVGAMFESEDKQLLAAASEMVSTGCAKALAIHDWKTFAYIYNGSGYATNHYDQKLSSWYAKVSGGGSPDLRIRAAQFYLVYLGYGPVTVDGAWGHQTSNALATYQEKVGMPISDQLDDATYARLAKEAATAVQLKPPFAA